MADAPEKTPAHRTPPLPDEAAVIARAAAGDRTAFAQLMEHYQSACYGLAWRLLATPTRPPMRPRTPSSTRIGRSARYRGGIFRSWLLRITANASYDILRRAQRRPSSPLPDPDEGAPELPDLGAINPLAEATNSEMYRHLEVALRRLPEDQRTAVVLCDVYGMDYNEVAAMTSSALGTVKSRIHRGRLRLRELLAEHRELFTG